MFVLVAFRILYLNFYFLKSADLSRLKLPELLLHWITLLEGKTQDEAKLHIQGDSESMAITEGVGRGGRNKQKIVPEGGVDS